MAITHSFVSAKSDGADATIVRPSDWNNEHISPAIKTPVRAATIAALAANTRTGNVLLANANGALAAIDGVTMVVGDRVLIRNEATNANNGIYVIDSLGSGSTKWQMTRAGDADVSAQFAGGMLVPVSEGTLNASAVFLLTTTGAITLNTTALTFATLPISLVLASASAAVSTEGIPRWDDTIRALYVGDSVQAKPISAVGWLPFAYPIGFVNVGGITFTTVTLAANGGSVAMPVVLGAPMKLRNVSIVNLDSASARTWGWDLYVDRLDNSATLNRVANSTANETFTPSGASVRNIDAASAPVVLAPGLYWLVIQCRHATNNFGLNANAASSWGSDNTRYQTKTTTNPNGATLDFTAATWTKVGAQAVWAVLRGDVFGQAAFF